MVIVMYVHLLVQNGKLDHAFFEHLFWGEITFLLKKMLCIGKCPPVCSFRCNGMIQNQAFFLQVLPESP